MAENVENALTFSGVALLLTAPDISVPRSSRTQRRLYHYEKACNLDCHDVFALSLGSHVSLFIECVLLVREFVF